jgi:hypothetical protein
MRLAKAVGRFQLETTRYVGLGSGVAAAMQPNETADVARTTEGSDVRTGGRIVRLGQPPDYRGEFAQVVEISQRGEHRAIVDLQVEMTSCVPKSMQTWIAN